MTVEKEADVSKLVLYVAGETPKSLAAISNLERICREHLDGKYAVEVIDLKKQPHLAREHSIVAISDPGSAASRADPQNHRRPVRYP